MTHRERLLAVLRGESYDRMPVVHFGFLARSVQRWRDEGHLTDDEAQAALGGDGSPGEHVLAAKLGFDFNYHTHFQPNSRLRPGFEGKVIEVLPDGKRKILTGNGTIILNHESNESIPAVVDNLLKGRREWSELYLPKLQFHPDRVLQAPVHGADRPLRFDQGGREYLQDPDRELPCLLHCGSLYGSLRDYLGIENLCYLQADDPALYEEMVEVIAGLSYQCAQAALQAGATCDIGHFWEDICYKNGPLVNPDLFARTIGPHYRRISALLNRHGLDLVSLDSDGMIDHLLPTWLANGVNVMFPIEVGTWHASLAPWRERYGQAVKGVGGVDKKVFARDYAAVEQELERLKPIVELGGYVPCPDHRLPHDNRWENVQYYCERFRETF